MKPGRIAMTDMLVSRSEIAETLAELGDEVYVCGSCGAEFTNPFRFTCGYCSGKLVKVSE